MRPTVIALTPVEVDAIVEAFMAADGEDESRMDHEVTRHHREMAKARTRIERKLRARNSHE